MSLAYRSEYEHMIGAKLAERQAAYELASPWLPHLAAIQRARIARTLAGAFGVSGAIAVALVSAVSDGHEPTLMLMGSVLGMLGVWVATRLVLAIAARRPRDEAYAPPALSGDLRTDLERLDASDAIHRLRAKLEGTSGVDLELVAIAVCLLAPLSIHGVLGFLMEASMNDYARWIRISLVLVGHAHITLAVLAARHVRQLRTPRGTGKEPSWLSAFGWTMLVTCIPGILLLAVPPLIAICTGLAFIPILFGLLKNRIDQERAIFALAMPEATPAPVRIAEGVAAIDTVPLPAEEPEATDEPTRQLVAGR